MPDSFSDTLGRTYRLASRRDLCNLLGDLPDGVPAPRVGELVTFVSPAPVVRAARVLAVYEAPDRFRSFMARVAWESASA
jgi:hypothetical protein